jgi:hypothetical protein
MMLRSALFRWGYHAGDPNGSSTTYLKKGGRRRHGPPALPAGIIKPIARLSAAVDELSRQNWKTPIPVRGRDELGRLANAFNHMASILKERESSFSRVNRDLFILHTAGLDLMESLGLEALLEKIAARAEDLVKADTTTVTAINRSSRTLEYLHVSGSKARHLKGLSIPVAAGGIYNWAASYGTSLLIPDAQADFRLDADQMRTLGIRSLLCVPLWSSVKRRSYSPIPVKAFPGRT